MTSFRKLPDEETLSFALKDGKETEKSPVPQKISSTGTERGVETQRGKTRKRWGSVVRVKYLNMNLTAMDNYYKVISNGPKNLVKTCILFAILKMECRG